VKKMLPAVVLAVMSAVAVPAFAQTAPASAIDSSAWSLQLGTYDDYNRLTLNYETAPVWQTRFSNGTRITLSGEFGGSYWHTSRGTRNNFYQLSAIPLFRYWPTDRLYFEAGIGATVFDSTHVGNKEISTNFQFGDHLGVGYRITNDMMIGYRFSHFSNASIKRPNPGLNVNQIVLNKRF
jgi:lipid A 3-O-deacylase